MTPTGYLAVDPEPMGLAASSDYVNWNSVYSTSGPQQDLIDVFYAHGLFIAAGNGIIMESVDGQTWNTVYTDSDFYFGPSTYGNGTYVTNAGTQLMASSDGINWHPVSIPANSFFYFVTYGNGSFVATGEQCDSSNCSQLVFTSSDLQSWKSQSLVSLTEDNFGPIAYNGQRFVILTDDHTGDGLWMLSSTNGQQWTADTFTAAPGAYFTQLRVADGQFMAIGGYSNPSCANEINIVCRSPYIATSNDGLMWNALQIGAYQNSQLNDIVYTGNQYIATIGAAVCGLCLSYEDFLYSTDGVSWNTLPGKPIDARPFSIATSGTRVVAVGFGGTIISASVSTGNIPPPGVPPGSGGKPPATGTASGGGSENLVAIMMLFILICLRNRSRLRGFKTYKD